MCIIPHNAHHLYPESVFLNCIRGKKIRLKNYASHSDACRKAVFFCAQKKIVEKSCIKSCVGQGVCIFRLLLVLMVKIEALSELEYWLDRGRKR